MRRYGSAASNARLGPEQTNDSRPALMTFALPDTGAARRSTPRACKAARSSAEPSSDIDEHSTISFGAAAELHDRRPDDTRMTASTSFHVDTMTNTMSHC